MSNEWMSNEYVATVKSSLEALVNRETPHVQPGKVFDFVNDFYATSGFSLFGVPDRPEVAIQYIVPKEGLKPVETLNDGTIKSTLPTNKITECIVIFSQDSIKGV